MKHTGSSSIRGFTLIELMVVIVIMAIMASLILTNINGVDQRKAMQAREVFIMDLRRMNREANDQARIFALDVQTATGVSPFRYGVVEYLVPSLQATQNSVLNENKKWQDYSEFTKRTLPEHVSFNVQSLDYAYENANNDDLLSANAPKLLWLGNGEAKPVRIQFYFEQRPIGEEIEIDHLGKINES
ncbi:prepilin-type N-terminal cleavage/methylation domain-containing protein [Acinetobacter terrae]|uniref:Prepilin-type N-terminal cleavage/methylation domain-containing protein n=1 Tax=Acinetobacter terrae TaxID=2731247 RepID=A0A4R0EP88_9GAMM|nr:prepilin-type N-terminal cleavage/methylation domain-containing protein [Acinetobacter terrae]TCB60603.1 prepilin-type N-terminal cleavage/methylation domain-containing protein [Acinetobacter terrae]